MYFNFKLHLKLKNNKKYRELQIPTQANAKKKKYINLYFKFRTNKECHKKRTVSCQHCVAKTT